MIIQCTRRSGGRSTATRPCALCTRRIFSIDVDSNSCITRMAHHHDERLCRIIEKRCCQRYLEPSRINRYRKIGCRSHGCRGCVVSRLGNVASRDLCQCHCEVCVRSTTVPSAGTSVETRIPSVIDVRDVPCVRPHDLSRPVHVLYFVCRASERKDIVGRAVRQRHRDMMLRPLSERFR